MNIKEMQYDLKFKLNKIDGQKYRNLRIPEMDWGLNEANLIFIKTIAEPRYRNLLGFEVNQRTIDDIKTIVKNTRDADGNCLTPVKFDKSSYTVQLPDDYMYYVSIDELLASKGECVGVNMEEIHVRQHDDRHQSSPFDESSFEWREVNVRFFEDKLRVFTDGSFSIDKVCLNYIRKPKYMHNAEDMTGGSYRALDGTVLTGTQDCELPFQVHGEIVDLAVLIITGNLQIPDYQVKQNKTKIND